MPSGPTLLSLLWGLSIVANATAALRLYQLDLNSTYRFFFTYLIFTTFRSLLLLPFDVRRSTYGIIYMITAPILWTFYVLVVLELYSLVLQNYSGIQSLGRWMLYAAIPCSILISVLTLVSSWSGETYWLLFLSTTVERGVVFSLVIFLLLIFLFLSKYPVPLNRNILVHAIIYTVFFLGISMTMFLRNVLGHEVMRILNHVLVGLSAACYLGWTLLLTRAGESRVVTLRRTWTREVEHRLVDQLNTINSTLLRVARK